MDKPMEELPAEAARACYGEEPSGDSGDEHDSPNPVVALR
jgi:hypothetical protein